MLKTVVKKGSYHDSVVLMLLTNEISAMDGVQKVQIMMATPANKDIFLQAGLDTAELRAATPNDMVIVADVESDDVTDRILKAVERKVVGTGAGAAAGCGFGGDLDPRCLRGAGGGSCAGRGAACFHVQRQCHH